MPPLPVEIANSILIFDAANNTWSKGIWNLFRKEGAYKYAPINVFAGGLTAIIAGIPGKRICISTIFFTVDGQTNIILYDFETPISGAMDLGGPAEPRGMVIPLGIFPIELGIGNNFNINSSALVQISGTVIYTQE